MNSMLFYIFWFGIWSNVAKIVCPGHRLKYPISDLLLFCLCCGLKYVWKNIYSSCIISFVSYKNVLPAAGKALLAAGTAAPGL
jgi:hypothetical protein